MSAIIPAILTEEGGSLIDLPGMKNIDPLAMPEPEIPQEEIPPPTTATEAIEQRTGITDDFQGLLKKAVDDLLQPENDLRNRLLAILRRNEFYWDGKQRVAFDSETSSYKTPADFPVEDLEEFELSPGALNGVINITRAHGESIIGALSTGIPSVRFYPKDANKSLDIIASKAYSKIAKCIEIHNKSEVLIPKALGIRMKQHFVAAHNFHLESEEFGTYTDEVFHEEPYQEEVPVCPNCTQDLSGGMQSPVDPSMIECPNCQSPVVPEMNTVENTKTVTEEIIQPEHRELIKLYGPKNIRIPYYCADLKRSPYLILEVEEHITKVQSQFPHIKDFIKNSSNTEGPNNSWARLPYQYFGSNRDILTVRYCWIRPWALEILGDTYTDEIAELKAAFPSGLCIVRINDIIADIVEEDIDSHWTIASSPTAEYLHDEPMIHPIIPVQDMTNDLTDLGMETIKQGISELFVDPEVVNPVEYKKHEASPGKMFPARPKNNAMQLGNSFYQTKNATLTQEFEYLQEFLTKAAQFVMGSFPSIYGGQISGSNTASEYAMSRNQALQRLSITWKTLISWWGEVIKKSVESHIKFSKEKGRDISYASKSGSSYTNVLIKLEELSGEIAYVEAESSDQFPASWAQKRQNFTELLQLNNPLILEALFNPNNLELVYEILGLSELQIPGEEDRNKQLMEIAELLKGQPVPGPQGFTPTILPEPELDEYQTHIQVCREWLLGPEGMDAKLNNNAGYMNVYAHYMQHVTGMMQKQAEEQAAEQENAEAGGKPGSSKPNGKPNSPNRPAQDDKTVRLPGEMS